MKTKLALLVAPLLAFLTACGDEPPTAADAVTNWYQVAEDGIGAVLMLGVLWIFFR